jgi:predicted enzyme related to lactoylglutathione lyase
MASRTFSLCEVVIDSADPHRVADFWAAVFGVTATHRDENWSSVSDPRPGGIEIGFQRVPEAKTLKNRVHLDLWSDDIDTDANHLVTLGARRQGGLQGDEIGDFQVMLDPEGNEFCLVKPAAKTN